MAIETVNLDEFNAIAQVFQTFHAKDRDGLDEMGLRVINSFLITYDGGSSV